MILFSVMRDTEKKSWLSDLFVELDIKIYFNSQNYIYFSEQLLYSSKKNILLQKR